MTHVRITLALAAWVCCASASAQSAPGSDAPVPEKTAPGTAPATNLDTKAGSLSDKLGATNGVIKPSGDVDPGMHVPAPQTGSTPVIRPGTTDGGTAK